MDVRVTRVSETGTLPREPWLKRWMGGFAHGAGTPMQGLRYLLRHPTLWPNAVLPMLINLAISIVVLTSLGLGTYHFLLWMHGWPSFAGSWWGRFQEIFWAIFVIAGALSLAAGSYLLIGGILTSYFNEKLARQVEIQLGTPASTLVDIPFKYQVIDGVVDFSVIAVTATVCLMLNCLPIIGTVIGGAVNLYIDCFVFGYDYVDIPMALRAMSRRDKRIFAKRHRPEILGLGATVFVMNFVPVIGSVLLTTAAVGAVLLYRDLRQADGESVDVQAA